MNALPDELVALIVSQLAETQDDIHMDDFHSLRCLAFVSRRFHRLARPNLYRTIVLNTTNDAPKLLARTLDENPDFAARVRTVEAVYTGPPESIDEHFAPRATKPSNKLRTLIALFGRLENLSTFTCSHRWGTRFLSVSHDHSELWDPFWHRLKVVRVAIGPDLFSTLPYLASRMSLERLIFNAVEFPPTYAMRLLSPTASNNIKHVTLRLGTFTSWDHSHSLQYLANHLPHLESLRVELANVHRETCICAIAMLELFSEQLSTSLRKLEIIHNDDAEVGDCLFRCHDQDGTSILIRNESSLRERLRKSKITHLGIDIDSIINRPQSLLDPWVISNIELPETLQQLDLRYGDPTERNRDAPVIPGLHETVEAIRRRFTALERINLELCTQWDHTLLLDPLKAEFAKVGITFRIIKKAKLPLRSWEPFPNSMHNHEDIRFKIFTGHGPLFWPDQ